jgi:hypothetical protein
LVSATLSGYIRRDAEEGTTTTPFDTLMLNDMDRFHLVIDVIDRVPSLRSRAAALRQQMVDERLRHRAYARQARDDDRGPRLDLGCRRGGDPGRTPLSVRALVREVLVVNAGSSSSSSASSTVTGSAALSTTGDRRDSRP